MNNFFSRIWYRIRTHRLETGFSMLEAVVVVGVLLALAIGAFLAYGKITENAKKAVVKAAASEAHTGVVSASFDGDATTDPQGVIVQLNASNTKTRVEITSPKAGETSANGDYCILAVDKTDPEISAQTGSCDTAGINPGGGGSDIVLASYNCGPETFKYTQSMKDITESNIALHKQGRDSEMKPGPGGWYAVRILDASADLGTPNSTVVEVGGIEITDAADFMSQAASGEAKSVYMEFPLIQGTSFTLYQYGLTHGHNTEGISFGLFVGDTTCKFVKQINGQVSSNDGSPAMFDWIDSSITKKNDLWAAEFVRDGKFYRDGGKPQVEFSAELDSVSVIGEIHYFDGTEVANSPGGPAPKPYTLTERPYTSTYPTR